MATNPNLLPDNSGRITAPDASYPYGSAKDDTTGIAGDGTPIKKALLNDTYGFYQWLMTQAGIVPSGSADTALVSQLGESLISIIEKLTDKEVTVNFASDADITLTAEQDYYGRLRITDTGVLLTASRSVNLVARERVVYVYNDTLQDLTIKTAGGTGVVLYAGSSASFVNGGVNTTIDPMTPIGFNQKWTSVVRTPGVTYTNTTDRPIEWRVEFTTSGNNTIGEIRATIDGVGPIKMASVGGTAVNQSRGAGSIIIPAGKTYSYTTSNAFSISFWELR